MQTQKYSVNQHLIETLLVWVKSGEIAIPEIQRPFVWDSSKKRATVFIEWYRSELKELTRNLIKKWEPILGVKVKEFGVKKMKTKWGTCNPEAGRIWLNLELAKKPVHCIEYIVVHEMVHLLEKSHNKRFIALLDNYIPSWRMLKDELNRLPLNEY
jgi:predicted metal-dependent hydrolase